MAFYANAPLPDTNARQVAQTIRPPSTSLLVIDSEDRFTSYTQASAAALNSPQQINTTPYNFTITKSESLMNGFFTRVGVSEVVFPWSVPNINIKTNIMTINWSGSATGTATITVLEGFYTPSLLAVAVQALVRTKDPSLSAFTMTYGQTSDPRFFYNTNSAGLNITFAPIAYNSGAFPWPNTTKQLFHLMGFSDVNTTIPSNTGVSGYTFCQFTRYVDIVCTQLTNNQALKDQMSHTVARDSLCRLYLGDGLIPGNVNVAALAPSATTSGDFTPPGCMPFTISRQFTNPKQIQWLPNQPIPGFLQFTVYDDAGAPLTETLPTVPPMATLADQATFLDWSMTMLVSEN